jgi:trk system potassium uptake protein TrkA
MRIAIAGAGNVGRSIAQELIDNGHSVLLIERQPRMLRPERVPEAEWLLADACELTSLEEADLAACEVMVAATGDDKANLVVSLLAKTEFAVPRVVARVNRAENEWLFTAQWGVDVAVSKPRVMAALVEEAVTVGELVRLMTFRQGEANLVEITLPPSAPYVGHPVRAVPLPRDAALVAILRGQRVLVPGSDDPLEAGDELVFICTSEVEDRIRTVVLGAQRGRRERGVVPLTGTDPAPARPESEEPIAEPPPPGGG